MGVTKTENFSKKQNQLATYAKAIAHPARVAILEYLLEHQTCICGDLVDELPLAQSTVSQHLKELKAVGIIKGEIEGSTICYCIDDKVWNQVQDMFVNLFMSKVTKNKCC
jgi:DNA-binding transcriptional ArsR family regulator